MILYYEHIWGSTSDEPTHSTSHIEEPRTTTNNVSRFSHSVEDVHTVEKVPSEPNTATDSTLSALITKLSPFCVSMTYFGPWSRRQPLKGCLSYRGHTYLLIMKPGGLLATAGGTTKPERCVDLFRVYSRKLVLFHKSLPLLMLLIPLLTQLHRLLTLSRRRIHLHSHSRK